MSEANPDTGADAIEVTDVESAAAALEAKYTTPEVVEEAEAEEVKAEEVEESEEADEVESDESDEREAEEESEDPQFHSIDELAEALEMSPDDFREQIKAKVKINGEEREVNLAELAKGYQLESDYRQKTMDLADNRRAFEEQTEAAKNELSQRLQEATNMVATLEQSILGEYNNVDWNTLRATDPAEYAALQQDYNQRYQSLQQLKAQATGQASQLQSEQIVKQEEARQRTLQKEAEALLDVIPEWKDSEVANKEKADMRNFLKSYKFTDDEIAQLADHRIVMMIRDAQKGKQVAEKVDVMKKKVSKAPKLQKPGAKQSKQTAVAKRNQELKSRLRKSGHVDDLAQALLARS
jgi:hypothetical protein